MACKARREAIFISSGLKFGKSLHARHFEDSSKAISRILVALVRMGGWFTGDHEAEATLCASCLEYLLLWLQPQPPMSPSVFSRAGLSQLALNHALLYNITHSLGATKKFHGVIQFRILSHTALYHTVSYIISCFTTLHARVYRNLVTRAHTQSFANFA